MKVVKAIVNVLGIIAAFLLSLVLVASLVTMPMVYSATELVRGDALSEVVIEAVQKLDYSRLARNNDEFQKFLDNNGLTGDILEDFMQTEAVTEMIECYVEDLTDALDDPDSKPKLDQDKLEEIMEEQLEDNYREIRPIIEAALEEQGLDPDDYDIREEAMKMVRDFGQGFLDELPTLQQLLGDDDLPESMQDTDALEDLAQTLTVLKLFRNGWVFWIMAAFAVVLTVLIFLCRRKRLSAFMWNTVDYGIAALVSFLMFALGGGISQLLLDKLDIPKGVDNALEAAVEQLLKPYGTFAAIFAVIAGVSLVTFLILRLIRAMKKKKETLENAPISETATPAAPQLETKPEPAVPASKPEPEAPACEPEPETPICESESETPICEPEPETPVIEPEPAPTLVDTLLEPDTPEAPTEPDAPAETEPAQTES